MSMYSECLLLTTKNHNAAENLHMLPALPGLSLLDGYLIPYPEVRP